MIEVSPGDEVVVYYQVYDLASGPVSDATVTADLIDSNGNKIYEGIEFSYIGGNGIYVCKFTAPDEDGYYVLDIAGSYSGGIIYDIRTIHVRSEYRRIESVVDIIAMVKLVELLIATFTVLDAISGEIVDFNP